MSAANVARWVASPNWPLPDGWAEAPEPAWDGTQACHDREDWVSAKDTAGKRATCLRCPLMGPCLAWALTHNEFGVWGSLTRAERLAVVLQFPRGQS